MSEKITIQQLESYLWGSANYLRNKIDAGDYKAYLFPLMFYKRICDVNNEEYQKALEESDGDKEYAQLDVNHQFQIPIGCHWDDLRKITKNVGQHLQKILRTIEKTNPDRLFGIFGDANWGNKERLSDETLIDLIEHFSKLDLSTKKAPDDLMGTAYEFLIKKFADDSGHTAAEFYTNRTVVTLMTELLDPQPRESIYDPTCGTGGMLLECVNHLKKQKKQFRSLRLFGQEKNMITSDIARMNMLLHGFEDAKIKRGDTLSEPLFLEGDKLKKFDVILANPPYSVNRWDQTKFAHDPYGRNIYGTPSKGIADYAFIQHIVSSQSPPGRSAILLPHGVLFRDSEQDIRKKIVEDDKLETVIGLPKDMFYNSTMESCIMIFKTNKSKSKKNKIQFINATQDFDRIDKKNTLNENQIKKIIDVSNNFLNVKGFSYIAKNEEVIKNKYSLNISLYLKKNIDEKIYPVEIAIKNWHDDSKVISKSLSKLSEVL